MEILAKKSRNLLTLNNKNMRSRYKETFVNLIISQPVSLPELRFYISKRDFEDRTEGNTNEKIGSLFRIRKY